jgi:hypothetical protein
MSNPVFVDGRLPDESAELQEVLREMALAINSEVGRDSTAVPSSGTWAAGTFVRNSAPAEAGSSPNKYVVIGWICTVSGTPGTWLACRCLTGN